MKTLFTITALLIAFVIQAQPPIDTFHVYKKEIHTIENGVTVYQSTVPNDTGTALSYLLANWETTDQFADLDNNGVVNVADLLTWLGDKELLWNLAQFNCGGQFSQWECFNLQMNMNGWYVIGVNWITPYIFTMYNVDTEEYELWYWVSF